MSVGVVLTFIFAVQSALGGVDHDDGDWGVLKAVFGHGTWEETADGSVPATCPNYQGIWGVYLYLHWLSGSYYGETIRWT